MKAFRQKIIGIFVFFESLSFQNLTIRRESDCVIFLTRQGIFREDGNLIFQGGSSNP